MRPFPPRLTQEDFRRDLIRQGYTPKHAREFSALTFKVRNALPTISPTTAARRRNAEKARAALAAKRTAARQPFVIATVTETGQLLPAVSETTVVAPKGLTRKGKVRQRHSPFTEAQRLALARAREIRATNLAIARARIAEVPQESADKMFPGSSLRDRMQRVTRSNSGGRS